MNYFMANGDQEDILLWLDCSYEKTVNLVCSLPAKWNSHIVIWAANNVHVLQYNEVRSQAKTGTVGPGFLCALTTCYF